jgi:hypothetical protein
MPSGTSDPWNEWRSVLCSPLGPPCRGRERASRQCIGGSRWLGDSRDSSQAAKLPATSLLTVAQTLPSHRPAITLSPLPSLRLSRPLSPDGGRLSPHLISSHLTSWIASPSSPCPSPPSTTPTRRRRRGQPVCPTSPTSGHKRFISTMPTARRAPSPAASTMSAGHGASTMRAGHAAATTRAGHTRATEMSPAHHPSTPTSHSHGGGTSRSSSRSWSARRAPRPHRRCSRARPCPHPLHGHGRRSRSPMTPFRSGQHGRARQPSVHPTPSHSAGRCGTRSARSSPTSCGRSARTSTRRRTSPHCSA